MREILFRGKRIDNDEWVYGSFVMDATELRQRERQIADLILANGFIRRYDFQNRKVEMFEVERDTVGQYTGLTDKNGKRIFEGDIITYKDGLFGCMLSEVRYRNGCFEAKTFHNWNSPAIDIVMEESEVEVIGNMFDNQTSWRK